MRRSLTLCEQHATGTVACSGGVFQNELLNAAMKSRLTAPGLQVWTNHRVPCNDGGISLGQAALAAFDGVGPTGGRPGRTGS